MAARRPRPEEGNGMTHAVTEQWDAGYPRVSTAIQVERDALQNQIQALEAYAAAHGLRLRLYPEAGVSAKDTDRPRLQELLADVRAGRVRSVVVTKLDRISRSLADLLDLMRLFEAHGEAHALLGADGTGRAGGAQGQAAGRVGTGDGQARAAPADQRRHARLQ